MYLILQYGERSLRAQNKRDSASAVAGSRAETKQAISNIRTATALYHIPGSSLVMTYLPISQLVLLSYQCYAMAVSLPA